MYLYRVTYCHLKENNSNTLVEFNVRFRLDEPNEKTFGKIFTTKGRKRGEGSKPFNIIH